MVKFPDPELFNKKVAVRKKILTFHCPSARLFLEGDVGDM
jgi:hypothetical protein